MRVLPFAVLAALIATSPAPASAQKIKDVLGAVTDQVTGRGPERERDAYERGREDQARHEDWRRDREARHWEDRRRERDW